jgi:hypothetical protein
MIAFPPSRDPEHWHYLSRLDGRHQLIRACVSRYLHGGVVCEIQLDHPLRERRDLDSRSICNVFGHWAWTSCQVAVGMGRGRVTALTPSRPPPQVTSGHVRCVKGELGVYALGALGLKGATVTGRAESSSTAAPEAPATGGPAGATIQRGRCWWGSQWPIGAPAPINVTPTAASARLENPLRQRLAAAASEPLRAQASSCTL